MPFTEPAILFHFLPGTLAAYHLAPARLRNGVLATVLWPEVVIREVVERTLYEGLPGW